MGTTFDSFHRNDAFDTRLRVDAFDVYGPHGGTEQWINFSETQFLASGSGYYPPQINFGSKSYKAGQWLNHPYNYRVWRTIASCAAPTGSISNARIDFLDSGWVYYTGRDWSLVIQKIGDPGIITTGDGWSYDSSGTIATVPIPFTGYVEIDKAVLPAAGGTFWIHMASDLDLASSGLGLSDREYIYNATSILTSPWIFRLHVNY